MTYKDYFVPFPTIKTPRLTLRKVERSDIKDLFEFCRYSESCEYSEWNPHKSIADTKSFVSWLLLSYKKHTCTVWAIVENTSKKVIGTCNFTSIDDSYKIAEIGYCLSKDYWGKGVATEAVSALISFGFRRIGLKRIQARIMVENTRSVRVVQKLGMEYEVTLKKAIYFNSKSQDIMVWAIIDNRYNFLSNNLYKDELNARTNNSWYDGSHSCRYAQPK